MCVQSVVCQNTRESSALPRHVNFPADKLFFFGCFEGGLLCSPALRMPKICRFLFNFMLEVLDFFFPLPVRSQHIGKLSIRQDENNSHLSLVTISNRSTNMSWTSFKTQTYFSIFLKLFSTCK